MLSASEGQEGSGGRSHQPGSEDTPPLVEGHAGLLAGLASEPLGELAERHNVLVHDTETGLILHDGDGATIAANGAAEHLLGLNVDEMRGRAAGDPRYATVGRSGSALAADDH